MPVADYILGSSAREQERLIAQDGLLGSDTRKLFEEAGVREGMRVLDLGSGAGDVAFIAAGLVGPGGEVVGIDRDPAQVELATARGRERNLANVQFQCADAAVFDDPGDFDAIVGRLVVLHMPAFDTTLTRLATKLRPGGIMAFADFHVDEDWRLAASSPDLVPESVQAGCALIARAFAAMGMAGLMTRLPALLATFGETSARLQHRIATNEAMVRADLQHIVATVGSLVPSARAMGLVGADAIDTAAMLEDVDAALRNHADTGMAVATFPLLLAWMQLRD